MNLRIGQITILILWVTYLDDGARRTYIKTDINDCIKNHHNLSNSCWDVSLKNKNINLTTTVEEKSGSPKSLGCIFWGTMNVSAKFHGSPSNSCLAIVQTGPGSGWPIEKLTLPSIEPCCMHGLKQKTKSFLGNEVHTGVNQRCIKKEEG